MITIVTMNGETFTLEGHQGTVHQVLLKIEELKGWNHLTQTLVSLVQGPLRPNHSIPLEETEFGLEIFSFEVIPDNDTLRRLVDQWLRGESTDHITQQYGDISEWRFSPKVNDMSCLFHDKRHFLYEERGVRCVGFNQDISRWNTHYIENMSQMFYYNPDFNVDIGQWDVAKVKNMTGMFSSASSFNQDLSQWDLSQLEYADEMFLSAVSFNHSVGRGDMRKVKTMRGMFRSTKAFNGNISEWQLTEVKDLSEMFCGATAFQQDIGGWEIGSVERIDRMFIESSLVGNIGHWDVSNLQSAYMAFRDLNMTTHDLSGWRPVHLLCCEYMFAGCAFDQPDFSQWVLPKKALTQQMFLGVNLVASKLPRKHTKRLLPIEVDKPITHKI